MTNGTIWWRKNRSARVSPRNSRCGGNARDDLARALNEHLAAFNYEPNEIRLSSLLDNFAWNEPQGKGEINRIRYLQDKGDAFRAKLQDGAALALAVRCGNPQMSDERAFGTP